MEATRLFGMQGEGLTQQHREEALRPMEGLALEGTFLCSCTERRRRLWAQAACPAGPPAGHLWGLTSPGREELAETV